MFHFPYSLYIFRVIGIFKAADSLQEDEICFSINTKDRLRIVVIILPLT